MAAVLESREEILVLTGAELERLSGQYNNRDVPPHSLKAWAVSHWPYLRRAFEGDQSLATSTFRFLQQLNYSKFESQLTISIEKV